MSSDEETPNPAVETSEDSEEEVEEKKIEKVIFEKPYHVDKNDDMNYDLGNLASFDPNALDARQLASNPNYLLELIQQNAQLLINHIFSLPTAPHPSEIGHVVAILPEPSTQIPREKPPPKPKAPTRWELFAKTKGIKKTKKSRMTFDEEKQEYLPRWGYKRANDPNQQWVLDHKEGADVSVDPFTALKQEKKDRIAKNKKQQLNNLRRAEGDRLPGTIDLTSAKELAGQHGGAAKRSKTSNKRHVDVALEIAQGSTASMGKFDRRFDNEPTLKASKQARTLVGTEKNEKDHMMSIYNKIVGKDPVYNKDQAANIQMSMDQKSRHSKKQSDGGRKRKKPSS
eukprot:TRINITY_DN1981_c0_g2_i1.p1 TRINITY_DN1981_c0_g2~~TRINITY_DN1981_c0_g2_i1.p1  ORF type:complete len:341 (+),score=120.80 TRINITY_DN1981_c0_g2_i1:67-1089(+)